MQMRTQGLAILVLPLSRTIMHVHLCYCGVTFTSSYSLNSLLLADSSPPPEQKPDQDYVAAFTDYPSTKPRSRSELGYNTLVIFI